MKLKPLLCLALVAGCSSDGDDGPLTSVDEDDAAAGISNVMCRLWTLQCDCDRNFFGTFEMCVDAATSFQEEQFQMARDAGLTYDPMCGAELINLLNEDIACKTMAEIQNDALSQLSRPACKLYFGTGGEGDECTSFSQAYGDSCAQGLQCLGTCMALPEPRPVRAVGEACDPATEACALGSACQPPEGDPGGATTCVAFPAEGQACTAGCAVGSWCDFDAGICKPPPAGGEPCNRSQLTAPPCAAGFYCDTSGVDDLCVTATAEGEPCSDFDECGAGFECREDGTDSGDLCLPEEAAICI